MAEEQVAIPEANPPTAVDANGKTTQRAVRPYKFAEDVLLTVYVAVGVISLALYLARCPLGDRIAHVAGKLQGHWILAVAVILPLFFRPLRDLLDEISEIAGLKRQRAEPVEPKMEDK